jgi:GMP synthase - Glutamine amidotransferase domain
MKIYVVDNGGQWTHKEYRVLKSLGVDSLIVDNDIDFLSIKDADGWVLSGGAPSINDELDKLKEVSILLDNVSVPVFGICIGAQFMALHAGGSTRKAPIPEFGRAKVRFLIRVVYSRIFPMKYTHGKTIMMRSLL